MIHKVARHTVIYSSHGTEPTGIVLSHFAFRPVALRSNLHLAGPAFYSETVGVKNQWLETLFKLVRLPSGGLDASYNHSIIQSI